MTAPQEVEGLIEAFLDDDLTVEETASLGHWLQADAAHTAAFLRRVELHYCIRASLAMQRHSEVSSTALPLLKQSAVPNVAHHMATFFIRPTPLSLSVAALVMGLFITAMALIAAPIYSRLARVSSPDNDIPPFVAQLTGAHDAQWAEGQIGAQPGAFLQAGHKMNLQRGLAEIEFRSGARVVLQGPAQLTIETKSQVTLARGRLTARVAAPARGFTVATSAATFVDLGTEFGVHVLDDTAAEVHVFEGVVEAKLAGQTVAQRITQGGGLRVDAATGTTRPVSATSSRFVRTMPQWVPIHVENASFEEPRLGEAEVWRHGVPAWANGAVGGGVSKFGREFAQPVPDGAQMAFLNEGELSQVLAETLQANTAYRLTVWIGNRPGTYSPNYSVELWAGGTELAKSENKNIPSKGHIAPVMLTFTTSDAQAPAIGAPLKIVLRSHGSLATATQNHFDLVSLYKLTTTSP